MKRKKIKISLEQKANLETNYRRLWLAERVHFPFMLRVTKLRKELNLPMKGEGKKVLENLLSFYKNLDKEDEKYFKSEELKAISPIISSVAKLKLSKRAKQKIYSGLFCGLPSYKFKQDIKRLMRKFKCEESWYYPLVIFLVTGNIYVPYQVKSKAFFVKRIKDHIFEDWKIFSLYCKKEAQHKFLKKQGFTTKEISRLNERTDELPDSLIHSNLDIAQLVWGDWDSLAKDKKMINLAKQRYLRLKRYFVKITGSDFKILQDLSSHGGKMQS